ncbi:MAG: hypothetical protein K2M55_04270 [Muribaculaceae bacterium]|nr:hypothetical protein [Muribaculaceae bacterium]
MKKLVLMLAVAFSMSFFACGNKEQAAEAEAPVEEAPVEVVEEAVAVDTVAAAEGDTAVVAEVAAEATAE